MIKKTTAVGDPFAGDNFVTIKLRFYFCNSQELTQSI